MKYGIDRPYDHYDEPEYDEPEPDEDCCCHEHHDLDWDGRATCHRCGHVWYLSAEDYERMAERDRQAEKDFRREVWRMWRQDMVDRLCFWRRWRKPKDVDDEIPF
jgi:hypothetical protein